MLIVCSSPRPEQLAIAVNVGSEVDDPRRGGTLHTHTCSRDATSIFTPTTSGGWLFRDKVSRNSFQTIAEFYPLLLPPSLLLHKVSSTAKSRSCKQSQSRVGGYFDRSHPE